MAQSCLPVTTIPTCRFGHQAHFELFKERKEGDIYGPTPPAELDHVQSAFSPFALADHGLGHAHPVRKVYLIDARSYPGLPKEVQQEVVFPKVKCFLHLALKRRRAMLNSIFE